MKDFLGQPIKSGDKIVYPTRKASSMWMNRATVIEVGLRGLKVKRDDGKIKKVQRIDRVVVLTGEIRTE